MSATAWAKNLTLLCIAVAIVVVLLGAFTRLAGAGLGCPDWPTCYGHLWVPQTAEEIQQANENYAETPVETDKTWPEQIHRIFASSLGVLIIGLVIACYQGSKTSKQPLKLSVFLLALVIVQGMFGMWTVTLKLWPQVVTAHLLGGFSTLILLWIMLQRLGGYRWSLDTTPIKLTKNLSHLAAAAMLAVILQVALGGWTSSNYAALACPDLPTCQNQWLPNADFSQGFNVLQTIGPNYLGGQLESDARTAIHFTHRAGAVIVSVIITLLAWRLWLLNNSRIRRWSLTLMSVLALQLALGISNVFWQLPLSIAVAHNAGGALLLLVLATINYRLYGLRQRIDKQSTSELQGVSL